MPSTVLAQIVRGQVVDSLTGAPLARASLSLVHTSTGIVDHTLADDEGLFLLHVPSPGAYRVRVEFTLYRTSTFPEFSVEPGAVTSFQLLVPRDPVAERQVIRALCGDGARGPILVGTLRDAATGEPVGGATVRYHVPAVPGKLASRVELDVGCAFTVDTAGTYVFCDLRAYTPIFLSAGTPDRRSEHARIMFVDKGVIDAGVRRTLSTSIYQRDVYLSVDSSWRGRLSAVVTDTAGIPIAGAHVRLLGSTLETRTDPAGRFRLSGVPEGLVTLEVRAVGHRPVQLESKLTGGEIAGAFPDRIVLDRLPVRLADIIATARPEERRLLEEGFFDREKWAQGSVISMNEYQRIHGRPTKLSEVLRTARSIRVAAGGTIAVKRCRGPTAMFVNNMYLPPLLPPESVDDFVSIDAVVGVEVHTGIGIPPRFRRQRNQCAAVVIWTY